MHRIQRINAHLHPIQNRGYLFNTQNIFTKMQLTHCSSQTKPCLADNYSTILDEFLSSVISNSDFAVPGLVVLAKRGDYTYHKAFGKSDIARGKLMQKDAVFRMYSMTKVLTTTVALMLYEKGAFKLNDPVSDFIKSFNREWQVVQETDDIHCPSVPYRDMITGKSFNIHYKMKPAKESMKIKHLMAECSGIGYEMFSDLDRLENGTLGLNGSYSVANGLRWQLNPTIYKSSTILGHSTNLAQFCDTIADAGVLVSEPGTFSYGHGATVLGRVIEIAYKNLNGEQKKLSEIFQEMLFDPLMMTDAAFFLDDEDPRIKRMPILYGCLPIDSQSSLDRIVCAEKSIPVTFPPYSNHTDHFSGPRTYESGDTGTCMTVTDYAKFCDFLLQRGIAPSGKRLLSETGVDTLCRKHLKGLIRGQLGSIFGVGGEVSDFPASFDFGWATTHPYTSIDEYELEQHPSCNFWSGYAGTHVKFYIDDDSYIIIGVQIMDHSGTGQVREYVQNAIVKEFLSLWR